MEPNRFSARLAALDANSVSLARPAPLRRDAWHSLADLVPPASQQHIAPDRAVDTDAEPQRIQASLQPYQESGKG